MDKRENIVIKNGIVSKVLEMILYIVIINASYIIPMYIGFQNKYLDRNIDAYYDMWIYITVASVFILIANKVFHTLKLTKTENVFIVLTTTLMIAFSVTAIAFIARSFALPRSIILLGFIIQTILFVIIKIILKFIYEKVKKEKNVAVFSDLGMFEEAVEKIFGSDTEAKEMLQFVSNLENFNIDTLAGIEKIYVFELNASKKLDDLIHYCIINGIQICIVPKSSELALKNSHFYLKADIPILKIDRVGLSIEYRFFKRFIDLILSSIGILLTLPVMLIVACVIYFTDDKQVIYRQKRVTLNNKVFTLYKFRTMSINAEAETGAVWCVEDDPRITKTGKFLRKYWLDELPQLFNVLKGDMTIVGPRPERPELIREFVIDYPDFKYRTMVKCGLTGYAQVMAKYETTPENKLKLDLFYILNSNFWLDINIIMLTIRKVFLRLFKLEKEWHRFESILDKWGNPTLDISEDIIYFTYET